MIDTKQMLICDVCGEPSTCGFNVSLDGVRAGYIGSWRCSEHHPHREAAYTREEWARARADGLQYPENNKWNVGAKPAALLNAKEA